MDSLIKICQYILASRQSKNTKQIKNLCNRYLTDHTKQVLTPPLKSLISKFKFNIYQGTTYKSAHSNSYFLKLIVFDGRFPGPDVLVFVLRGLTMCAGAGSGGV